MLRDNSQLNYIASLSGKNKGAYKSNEWLENYDTNPEGCRVYSQFRNQVQRCNNYFIEKNLFHDNTKNTGLRYAYACDNTMEIPCPRSGCRYDPTQPIYKSASNPIFVKEANIMRPDGKGVEEDIQFADDKEETLVSSVTAQDTGEGSIFKCDQPGAFALIFDDGPDLYTTSLLKILQENQIKSTFFFIGKQVTESTFSKHLKQILDKGHQIGSHTYFYPSLNKISPEMIKEEMLKTEKAIETASGVVPVMMRPPYGDCNEGAEISGYPMEKNDSQEWTFMEQSSKYDTLKANILNAVTNGNPKVDNFVSLQHEILSFSVEGTPEIIDGIKAKGYHFVTVNVSQCTRTEQILSPTAPFTNQGAEPSSSAAPDVQVKSESNSSSVVESSSAMALLISAFSFWIHN
ncbi:hypothetical protein K7432_014690 [Basidiobolus ranarum]|uniref:NodB homology domain-containing protein n=1 Tax=Basidiobolus ranarum TaxID=34480 RepID=A0ABR2WH67_9FUNG